MTTRPRVNYQTFSTLVGELEQAVCLVEYDRAPVEKTSRSAAANRLIILLLVSVAVILIGVRFYVNSGWGDGLLQPREVLSAFGFEKDDEDNLSYLSWIQQARLGHF